MRSYPRVFVPALLAATACQQATVPDDVPAPGSVQRPNIVLVLVDDMTFSELAHLRGLQELLQNRGTTFTNYFVTNPLCCPSRASLLTGRYAHNTQILNNVPPTGGADKFRQYNEWSTIATWLKPGGYRTGLIGKYLNGYGTESVPYVPPGWDTWIAATILPHQYYNYWMFENDDPAYPQGKSVLYGSTSDDYKTAMLTRRAVAFIRESSRNSDPFFLYLTPAVPHWPSVPPPGAENEFEGIGAPRTPSFNEADISDKPQWFQSTHPVLINASGIATIDETYRRHLQTMLGVQEMVRQVLDALQETGKLDSTYVLFTSDNGFHFGEHRIPSGKQTTYDESVRVPLIVSGPGIPAGRVSELFVMNHDLAPTIAELAGVSTPFSVDGTSIVPLLFGKISDRAQWRTGTLLEYWWGASAPQVINGIPSVAQGYRTPTGTYVEYNNGEREFYLRDADPNELVNRINDRVSDGVVADYRSRLERLRTCAGQTCRETEWGR